MEEEIVLPVHYSAVTSAHILPPQLVMSATLRKQFPVSESQDSYFQDEYYNRTIQA